MVYTWLFSFAKPPGRPRRAARRFAPGIDSERPRGNCCARGASSVGMPWGRLENDAMDAMV